MKKIIKQILEGIGFVMAGLVFAGAWFLIAGWACQYICHIPHHYR